MSMPAPRSQAVAVSARSGPTSRPHCATGGDRLIGIGHPDRRAEQVGEDLAVRRTPGPAADQVHSPIDRCSCGGQGLTSEEQAAKHPFMGSSGQIR